MLIMDMGGRYEGLSLFETIGAGISEFKVGIQ